MKTKYIILMAVTLLAIALMTGCTTTTSAEPETTAYVAETEGTVESATDILAKGTNREINTTPVEMSVKTTTEESTVAETTVSEPETTEAVETTKAADTKQSTSGKTNNQNNKPDASASTEEIASNPPTQAEQPAETPAEAPVKNETPVEQPKEQPVTQPAPAPTEAPTEAPKPVETEAPVHEHSWKEHYATRQILVRDAWVEEEYVGDETRDIVEYRTYCSCGADITGISGQDHIAAVGGMDGHGGWVERPVVVGQKTVPMYIPVFHDAEYTNEQYVDYYYCDCGATK